MPIFPPRRRALCSAGSAALALIAPAGARARLEAPQLPSISPAAMLDDIEARTFRYFWDSTNPQNGLVPDRWPAESFCSIGAVGFALSAYPIGVERGWITRPQARDRVLTTLKFLRDLRQGAEPTGTAGFRGFFYHFLDMSRGTRFDAGVELSSMDTALMLAGALHCQSWFDGTDAGEVQIRALADELYLRVDWRWLQVNNEAICQGWYPATGYAQLDWRGYNEAMLVYLLALGSPTHSVEPDAWTAWTSTYERSWTTFQGQEYLHFAPLFGHLYSHCWVDFRGIRDRYMAERGFDYFENSRRAAYAQRAYAIANPMGWKGYDADCWGISACDGPVDVLQPYGGHTVKFRSYAGRGAGGAHTYDDGTIAPYAAAAALPFAPEIVVPALQAMLARYGSRIYTRYGFLDAFNPSYDYDGPLRHGQRFAGWGWVDTDYLGIDQGPILLMLANHRADSIWRVMRGNRYLRRGLDRAGFKGGWLG